MLNENFKPLHINAEKKDFLGNNGSGRYIFLPGSDNRAKEISSFFDKGVFVKKSSRNHNLYLGTITKKSTTLDVCSISTGMGTPSAEIIINELLKLGAKKFLRVGTCGLLQDFMNSGDIAVATSSVKDEAASSCYVPIEYPSIASIQMINSIISASESISNRKTHFGVFHTKSSLYAREFKQGIMKDENQRYMGLMKDAGAIASEMESSILFTLCGLADANILRETLKGESLSIKERVISGAICGVLGKDDDFGSFEFNRNLTNDIIKIAINSFFQFHNDYKI